MPSWRCHYQTTDFSDVKDFSERESAMQFVESNAASVILATVFAIDFVIMPALFYKFEYGKWRIYGDEAIILRDPQV